MDPVQISDRRPISDYKTALAVVSNVQATRGVDLRVLVDLLSQFFELPEGNVLLPRVSQYPSRYEIEKQISVAITSMNANTLSPETLRDVLPSIVTIYELHALRIDAISAKNSSALLIPGIVNAPADIVRFVPPNELCSSHERLYLLRDIDNIIQYFYEALENGALKNTSPTLGYIVNFAYQVVSHHGPEQGLSGQSESVFFSGLQRGVSHMYLRLILVSTLFVAQPDVISPSQVLNWAERITQPLTGADEQGRFIKTLFPRKVFDPVVYRDLPVLTKAAIRCPYEVWTSLRACCLGCGADGRYTCSRCGIIKYCGGDCQRRHWTASHKIVCSMYRTQPV